MTHETNTPLHIRIFLSSPGDVQEERRIIYNEIDDFIYNHPAMKNLVHLEAVGWDHSGKYIPLEASEPPQYAIDNRMAMSHDCDIVFIVLKSRMGTLLDPKYKKPDKFQYNVLKDEDRAWFFSGTEWEYVKAMERATANNGQYPHVFVFRCRESVVPAGLNNEEWQEYSIQMRRIENFAAQFGPQGPSGYLSRSYDTYSGTKEFREKIRMTLGILVKELYEHPPEDLRLRHTQTEYSAFRQGSPFPGLRSFGYNDAPVFFGREQEIDELAGKVKHNRFVAVVGASGAGKSSVVRAGLLPALAKDAILQHKDYRQEWDAPFPQWEIESSSWVHAIMTPGEIVVKGLPDPFVALYRALAEAFPEHADLLSRDTSLRILMENCANELVQKNIAAKIDESGNNEELSILNNSFRRLIEQFVENLLRTRKDNAILLLLIDQFEELFAIVTETQRKSFIKLIEQLSLCTRVRIVATMRADFYEQCLQHRELAALFVHGTYPLSPPGLSALNKIIRQPAALSGLEFETNLAEKILVDTAENIGGLPMMAYLLEQMYDRCKDSRLMNLAVYDDLGGVTGAIGRKADKIIEDIRITNPYTQDALHAIFKELIGSNDIGIATKKSAMRSSIIANVHAEILLDKLVSARLLVTTRQKDFDTDRFIDTIEIAHEALLTTWSLLRTWIADRKDDYAFISKVKNAMIIWKESGRNASLLWDQTQLDIAYSAYKNLGYDLRKLEDDYQVFLEPESQRIIRELSDSKTSHVRRSEIGNRLFRLKDTRPGIGVDDKNIPQISWCKKVKEGTVCIAGKDISVAPFYIAQYPVTLGQFNAFIHAQDGYYNSVWWEGLGKNPREHKPFNQIPEIGNHPACWLSWYQAVAFCRWMSKKLGYIVRIPYEREWQLAAGGDQAFLYPWGNEWDAERCNSIESGLNSIVSTGMYPNGRSPTGAEDMVGNVYEWCMDHFDTQAVHTTLSDELPRVTRGGAYFVPRSLLDRKGITARDAFNTCTRLDDNPIAPAMGSIRVSMRLAADIVPG